MKKQFLFLVLLGLLCSIGSAWAVDPVQTYDLTGSSAASANGVATKIGDAYIGRKGGPITLSENYGLPSGSGNTAAVFEVNQTSTITMIFDNQQKNAKSGTVNIASVTNDYYNDCVSGTLGNMPSTAAQTYSLSFAKNANSGENECTFEASVTAGKYIIYWTSSINSSIYLKRIEIYGVSTTPSITASNVNIGASATAGSIIYSINNPVDGGLVTAAKKGSEEWLTAVGTEPSSPISFNTQPNTGAARSATVTLTYTYGDPESTVTKDVTITQAAPSFAITKGSHSNGDFSISPNPAGFGGTVTLSAAPSSGYAFVGWQIVKSSDSEDVTDLVSLSSVTNPNATFTMPAYAVTINATFAAPNIYFYKDAEHYVETTYMNPEGGIATGTDDVTLSSSWAICDECVTGVTSVIATGCLYDNKENHMNAYIKVPTGGGKDAKNISFTITDGYKAVLKIKMGGYSSNPSVTLKKLISGSLGDNIAYSGSIGGVATKEDDFKELIWDIPSGGTYVMNVSSKNAYVSQIDIQTTLVSVSKTISDAGWATFCSPYALDFSSAIANLEAAYLVTGATGDVVDLDEVKGTVPAGTGRLLKGEGECVIPVVASSATNVSDNKLVGKTAEYTLPAGQGYVLLNGANGVGFYINPDAAFTVGANTAYLPLGFNSTGAPSAFRLVDEENNATNIENVEANETAVKFFENGQIYILRDGITYDAIGRKVR